MSEQTGMELTRAGETAVARQEEGPPITSLVQLAVEKGVDVAVLERLVALQERVTDKNARAAYFDALSAFQEEVPQIPKGKRVKYVTKAGARVDYSYSPLDAITKVIRPALRKHGLSYSWDVDSTDGGVMNVACVLRHVDGHSERSTFPVPIDNASKMSAAQANGAALTYGKRQSLIAVLGLTTTDDDVDGATPAAPSEVETITDSQAADLDALIDETGANRAKVLKYFQVDALTDLPAERLAEATSLLEQRRNR